MTCVTLSFLSGEEAVRPLFDGLRRGLELEALGEVRERLLDLLKVPGELFRIDVERVAGRTSELRASLKLTDAGANLAAALGAGEVDRLVVEQALGHFHLSGESQPGDDAESSRVATSPTTVHRS